jgi:hypothetical protein
MTSDAFKRGDRVRLQLDVETGRSDRVGLGRRA